MIDIEKALHVLTAAGVEFMVVGGVAARAHGSARTTNDLDVIYRRTPENIARLVAALAAHAPYLRGAPRGLPFRWDAETVQRGLDFTLTTAFGDLYGSGAQDRTAVTDNHYALDKIICR